MLGVETGRTNRSRQQPLILIDGVDRTGFFLFILTNNRSFHTQPAAFRHVHAMNHTPAAFVFEDSLAQAFQLERKLGGGEKGEGLRAYVSV